MVDSNTSKKIVLFATANKRKLAEVASLALKSGIEIIAPEALSTNRIPEVAETGTSYAENAELKARFFAERFDILSLGDDSGLEVLALKNQPGVRSRRWHPGSDADRNKALLKKLDAVADRRARFTTVFCLYDPTLKQSLFFEGSVAGNIAKKPSGKPGFGYDPIFIPEGESKTFAELSLEEKNKLSHRAKALTLVLEHLKKT